jgi:hypothetical protein
MSLSVSWLHDSSVADSWAAVLTLELVNSGATRLKERTGEDYPRDGTIWWVVTALWWRSARKALWQRGYAGQGTVILDGTRSS